MGSNTPNHTFYKPDSGETGWASDKNSDWSALDTRVEIRDTSTNRSNYAAVADALYRETDTGRIYLGDGSTWNLFDIEVATLGVVDTATFADNATDPTTNGEFSRNGTDMKVYSGGGVQNLSNIGTGSYTDEQAQDAIGVNYDATMAYDDTTPAFGIATGGVDTAQLAAQAVTPTEVDGSGGTAGQVLQTDGTANGVTWSSDDSGSMSQVGSGTVTATGGVSPAVDTRINGVTLTQTEAMMPPAVYVDADPTFNADYAFNYDHAWAWDDSAGAMDMLLTVNWDIDPGSGNDVTLRWEVNNA